MKSILHLATFFTYFLRFFPPEFSHLIALIGLKALSNMGIRLISLPHYKKEFLGISFRNTLGLSAGLDKNGDYIEALDTLGFGFIELGTVTPKSQSGNDKPRLWRNSKNKDLINKMGFNNKGVKYLISKLDKKKFNSVIGISIGKNALTDLKDSVDDYIYCLKEAYPYADYIAVNISSPNTKDLRELEGKSYFEDLVDALIKSKEKLKNEHGSKPIFIKVSPDMEENDLLNLCQVVKKKKIEGIIATNTTINHPYKYPGGMSGKSLLKTSNKVLENIRKELGPDFLLIGCGGVNSKETYDSKIRSGADLVQIYTGFIFKGPKLIKDILK